VTDEVKAHAAVDQPASDERRYPDTYSLYRRWFDVLGDVHEETKAGSVSPDELKESWKRWFEAAAEIWNGNETVKTENDFVGSIAPLWEEMAEDISAEMLSGETLPEDPIRFFLQWYNATSEAWSKRADELLKEDEVLESNSRFFETYARSYGELRRASEEGLKNLRIPTRSDVTRVARLVVGVENKVDRMEEAFEEFAHDYSETRGDLEERMDRLESKMDRVLAALEKIAGENPPDGPDASPGSSVYQRIQGIPEPASRES
jgi:hypothetical protein